MILPTSFSLTLTSGDVSVNVHFALFAPFAVCLLFIFEAGAGNHLPSKRLRNFSRHTIQTAS